MLVIRILVIEELVKRLRDRNLTKVADACKLSYPVVHNVAHGKNASYTSVKILSDYLENNP